MAQEREQQGHSRGTAGSVHPTSPHAVDSYASPADAEPMLVPNDDVQLKPHANKASSSPSRSIERLTESGDRKNQETLAQMLHTICEYGSVDPTSESE
jgi:hypothetical protein